MHRLRSVFIILLAALLIGCGSSDSTPEQHRDAGGGGGGNGGTSFNLPDYDETYKLAKDLCSAYPREEIAREYGVSPSAPDSAIARAYAQQSVVGKLQPATIDGCMAGLR